MRRGDGEQAGFTLIEVLIGITLLAMLGTLIASGTRLGGRAWSDAEARTSAGDDVTQVQGLFRRTILRAAPAFASSDPGDTTILFAGEPRSLTLMAPQPGTQYGGPWTLLRFSVERRGASQALFVRLSPAAATAGTDAASNPILLLDHVADARFAYFGPPSPDAAPVWQDSWLNRSRLPDLISLSVARDNPALPRWPPLIVATRTTANAGCIYGTFVAGCQRVRQ